MTNKRFTRIICSNDEYTGSLYCNDEPLKIDTVCNLLNELNNENNHIKQTIQEAYNNERTHIGRNVLKQLIQSLE